MSSEEHAEHKEHSDLDDQATEESSTESMQDLPHLKWDAYTQELIDNNELSESSYKDLQDIGFKKEWVDDFIQHQREKLFEHVLDECRCEKNISCSTGQLLDKVILNVNDEQKKTLLDNLNSFKKDKMKKAVDLLLKIYSQTPDEQASLNADEKEKAKSVTAQEEAQDQQDPPEEPPIDMDELSEEDDFVMDEEAQLDKLNKLKDNNLGYQLLYQSKSSPTSMLSEGELIRRLQNPLYRNDSNYRKQLQRLLVQTRYFTD